MDVLSRANRLEGILRNYLDCGYNDFGVKANGDLDMTDWRSPINFALGVKFAEKNRDANVKEAIDDFLGNEFDGICINDLVTRYEYYGFESANEALSKVDEIIDGFEKLIKL